MRGQSASAFLKALGFMIVGGVVGSAMFMLIYQHNFSQLVSDNHSLRNENIELTEDLNQLRKNEKKFTVIKQIDARMYMGDNDQMTADIQEELEKKVRDGLKVVYGQKITTAKENALVYDKLITSRNSYVVLDKNYTVSVKFFALIGTELTVWFTAKEIHTPNPAGT